MKSITDFITRMKADKSFRQGVLAAKREYMSALLNPKADGAAQNELSSSHPNIKTHVRAGLTGTFRGEHDAGRWATD